MSQSHFGELRSLLAMPRSKLLWQRLCWTIDTIEADDFRERYRAYLTPALEDWPDWMRVTPPTWIERALDPAPFPQLGLARTLSWQDLGRPEDRAQVLHRMESYGELGVLKLVADDPSVVEAMASCRFPRLHSAQLWAYSANTHLEHTQTLQEMAHNPTLESLRTLSLTGFLWSQIAPLFHHSSSLKELDFLGVRFLVDIPSGEWRELLRAPAVEKIRHLSLAGIDSQDLSSILQHAHLPVLRTLSLLEGSLHDADLVRLTEWEHAPTLRYLALEQAWDFSLWEGIEQSRPRITRDGLEVLAQAPSLEKLEGLAFVGFGAHGDMQPDEIRGILQEVGAIDPRRVLFLNESEAPRVVYPPEIGS